MILRGIVCIIFLYFLFYMTGFLFSQITRQKPQEGKIVYGSVLTIAAFEIICFPFLILIFYTIFSWSYSLSQSAWQYTCLSEKRD